MLAHAFALTGLGTTRSDEVPQWVLKPVNLLGGLQKLAKRHTAARAVKGRPFVKPNRKIYPARKDGQLLMVKQLEDEDESSAAEFERSDNENAYCVVCAQIVWLSAVCLSNGLWLEMEFISVVYTVLQGCIGACAPR